MEDADMYHIEGFKRDTAQTDLFPYLLATWIGILALFVAIVVVLNPPL